MTPQRKYNLVLALATLVVAGVVWVAGGGPVVASTIIVVVAALAWAGGEKRGII